jgi:hypothetical protein
VKIIGSLGVLGLLLISQPLHAVCASLVRGQIMLDIQSCSNIQPEQAFASSEPKYNFIRDLPPPQRKVFLDSYRGLSIKAKVARSFAVRSGLSPEKGALSGEVIKAYIPPQNLSCGAISGKRIQAVMDEVCCEGGGEAPCLLGTSYMLKKPAVLGAANSKAGHRDSHLSKNPEYIKAQKLLLQKDYKQATVILDNLNFNGKLDVQGKFLLAAAYRDMDKCPRAIPILEDLYQRFEKSDFWTDDEPYIRRANFLYARCLSMQEKAGEAVMILQGFLVEPKKYRKEILESFSHPDFGYIKTSKPYMEYKQSAQRALAEKH